MRIAKNIVAPLSAPPGKGGAGGPAAGLWWRIPSLAEADIIDVWTFDADNGEELIGEVNGLTWEITQGTPTINPGEGFNFGGSSGARIMLPNDINTAEMSFVMQFDNASQNGTIDAFFSHYLPNSTYTLQNDFRTNLVRWSAGEGEAPTFETTIDAQGMTENVYGGSGSTLYIAGQKIGGVDGGWSIINGHDFNLGRIQVETGFTQNVKARIKKFILTKRLLTPGEQWELYYRIIHGVSPGWWLPPGLDETHVLAAYDFATAKDITAALRADFGPDLAIMAGSPGHEPGKGVKFGGSGELRMSAPVSITPGEATIAARMYDAQTPEAWQAICGFENRPASAVLLQHNGGPGVALYNGEGYDGTDDNYVTNAPSAQNGEWLFNAAGKLYRDGVLAANELTPTVLPALDARISIGSINGEQWLRAGVSNVLVYDAPLTKDQIEVIISRTPTATGRAARPTEAKMNEVITTNGPGAEFSLAAGTAHLTAEFADAANPPTAGAAVTLQRKIENGEWATVSGIKWAAAGGLSAPNGTDLTLTVSDSAVLWRFHVDGLEDGTGGFRVFAGQG